MKKAYIRCNSGHYFSRGSNLDFVHNHQKMLYLGSTMTTIFRISWKKHDMQKINGPILYSTQRLIVMKQDNVQSRANCPMDNWSSPESKEFAQAIDQLSIKGLEVSIQNLEELGVSKKTIQRIIIIEFGSEKSSFAGFVPEGYMLDGEGYVLISKLGWDFK